MLLAERGETQSGALSVELVREVGREAEAMYPDDSEILLAVGRMYLAGGEIQKALRPLTRAGKIKASSRAFRLLGEVLLRLGDAQVAVAMFKRAIQDGEDDPDTEGWYASAKAYVPIQEAHGDAVVAQSVAAGLAQVTAAEEPEPAEQPEAPATRARMPSVHGDRPLPRFPSVVDLSAAAAIAASMTASAGGEDQPLPRFPSSADLKSALFQHALSDDDRSALEEELTGPTAQQSVSSAVRTAARAALSEPPAGRPAAAPAEPPRVHPAAATPAAPIAARPPVIEDERSDLPLDEPTGDSQIATGVYPRTSPEPIPTVVVNAEPRPAASASSAANATASAPSAAIAMAGAPRAAMKTVPLAASKAADLGLRGTVRMNLSKDGIVLAGNGAEPAAGKGSPALAGHTIPMTVGMDGDVAPISTEGSAGAAPARKPAKGAADSRATRPEAPPAKSSSAPASAPGAKSAPPAGPASSSAPPAAVLPVSLVDHSAWDREIAPRHNSIPVVAAEPRRRRGRLAMRLAGGVLLLGILGVAGSVLAGKPPWLAGWLPGRASQSPDSAGVQPVSEVPPKPTVAATEAPAPEPPVTAAAVDPPAPEPESPALDDAGVAPVATTEPVPTAEPVAKDAGAAAAQTAAPPRVTPPKRKEPEKASSPTKVPPPPTKAPKTSKPTKVPGSKQKDVVWLGDPERSP